MRILIIHQQYLGESDGGGSRFNQFARYWAGQDHQVTVLAGTVHYATGERPARFRNRLISEEHDENGVRVFRCYMSKNYGPGYLSRLWGYFSFVCSATWAGLFRVGKHDVLIASSPPLFVGITGYIISRLWRIPLLFEVRDLWPQFAVETGVLTNRQMIRLGYRLERFIYGKARHINVLTPAFRDVLLSKEVPDEKLTMIPNGADLDLFHPGDRDNDIRRRYHWGDRFVVIYTGAHGPANGLGQVLDAAKVLLDRTDILFVLVGDGTEKAELESRARRLGLTNVQFIPAQAKSEMPDFINAADVGLAVLQKIDGFKTVYPNKLFDYMACGRPVIVAIDGEARNLIERAGAGIYVEPECPTQLRCAVLELCSDAKKGLRFGKNGFDFVRNCFSREGLASEFLDLLHVLVRSRN